MKKIHGITQKKFLKVIIPIDRECCDDPSFSLVTAPSSDIYFDGNGTEDSPLTAYLQNPSGGGLDYVHTSNAGSVIFSGDGTVGNQLTANVNINTEDSASIIFSGTGTSADPLSATINPSAIAVDTIYTADGTLANDRTVTFDGNDLTFTGGAGTTLNLNAAGQQVRLGSAGFNISNGGFVNSNFEMTGGGTFTLSNQGSIQLQKVTAGGSTSTLLMNPSNIQGVVLQDVNGANSTQILLNSTGSTPFIRYSAGNGTANLETAVQQDYTGFTVNRNTYSPATITPIFKVDTSAQTVILSQITNAPFLTTSGTGVITAGTKAAHVDPTTGTVTQVINALIAAGLMA